MIVFVFVETRGDLMIVIVFVETRGDLMIPPWNAHRPQDAGLTLGPPAT